MLDIIALIFHILGDDYYVDWHYGCGSLYFEDYDARDGDDHKSIV